MIDRIDTSRIPDILSNTDNGQQQTAQETQNISADASLEANYAELIKQAADALQDDTNDIQKIKELLNSGRLDSFQNARQAAQNIIDSGV